MNQPFRLPDPANDAPSREENPSGDPRLRFAPDKLGSDDNDEIRQVARTLAEHGGSSGFRFGA